MIMFMRSALVRSASYYYHPEVVVAACVPVGDTGAMRLAAAAAAAAAAVVAACVPERGTEEKGLVLLTPPTHTPKTNALAVEDVIDVVAVYGVDDERFLDRSRAVAK